RAGRRRQIVQVRAAQQRDVDEQVDPVARGADGTELREVDPVLRAPEGARGPKPQTACPPGGRRPNRHQAGKTTSARRPPSLASESVPRSSSRTSARTIERPVPCAGSPPIPPPSSAI